MFVKIEELIYFVCELSRRVYQQVLLISLCEGQVNGVALFSKLVVALCPPACHNGSRSSGKIEFPPCFEPRAQAFCGVCELVPLSHAAQHRMQLTVGSRRVFGQFPGFGFCPSRRGIGPPPHRS